jgi:hypothetical protein
MKTLKISFAFLFSAFLVACSTSTVSSDDKCVEQRDYSVHCAVYDRDECGNVICGNNDSALAFAGSIYIASIYEAVEESGLYTTKDSVAAYLCKFDKLPDNYVGKNEGKSLYESKTGRTFDKWNFNPWTTLGVMIGGDVYENNDGLLPSGSYHEADVDYSAKNRGTKRLIYQSDCVIYYTADHYESFDKLEVR